MSIIFFGYTLETIDKRAKCTSSLWCIFKQLKKTAQIPFVLKTSRVNNNDQEHEVFNEDINKLVGKIEGDILYLDPPKPTTICDKLSLTRNSCKI